MKYSEVNGLKDSTGTSEANLKDHTSGVTQASEGTQDKDLCLEHPIALISLCLESTQVGMC